MNDTILQQAIDSGRLGKHPFHWHKSIDSTNLQALNMAQSGAESWTIVMAQSQNCGRGRLDRNWFSPPGSGLYVSIILRPQLAPEHLSKITLAAGVAVSRAVDFEAHISTMIKWPNDILAEGRKIAGILVESTAVNHQNKTAVVLGIGINVTTPLDTFPQDLKSKATSLLAVTGKSLQKGALLKRLVCEIDQQTKLLEDGKFLKILEEWKMRDATLGKRLNWLNTKNELVCGVSMGPDVNGRLKIKDVSGEVHEVISGDVNLCS